MKRKFKYLLFFAAFLAFIFYIESHKDQRLCNLYKEYLNKTFDGVVVKKFIDSKEHSFPFVYIKNHKNGEVEKLNLFNDINHTYEAINLNDSIVKIKNDPWIYKRSNSELIKIKLISYGCRDSLTGK